MNLEGWQQLNTKRILTARANWLWIPGAFLVGVLTWQVVMMVVPAKINVEMLADLKHCVSTLDTCLSVLESPTTSCQNCTLIRWTSERSWHY